MALRFVRHIGMRKWHRHGSEDLLQPALCGLKAGKTPWHYTRTPEETPEADRCRTCEKIATRPAASTDLSRGYDGRFRERLDPEARAIFREKTRPLRRIGGFGRRRYGR